MTLTRKALKDNPYIGQTVTCVRELIDGLEKQFSIKIMAYRKCKKGQLIVFPGYSSSPTWYCQCADGLAGRFMLIAKKV